MDRSSRGLSLAFVLLASAFYQQSSFAAVGCATNGGISTIGVEAFPTSLAVNSNGQYLYRLATVQCSGGQVTALQDIESGWYYPEDLLAQMQVSHVNMRRVFANTCRTHVLVLHDNFRGTIDGVATSQFAAGKQIYADAFTGPIFYSRPSDVLTCPETSGIGNPDFPKTCPVVAGASETPRSADPTSSVADPVNVSNGNSYQVEVDYPGQAGSQMHFARYYNSKTANWTHTYSAKLKIAASQVMLVNTDGRESLFTVAGGVVTASLKELGQLAPTASGWRYDNTYNEHLHFDTAGRLTRIDRPNGTYETLTYGTNNAVVTDSLGRSMTLTFDTTKRLAGLSAASLQVAYTYSTASRLSGVTRTQGGQAKPRTYHYEDTNNGGLLTGITDERNIRYVTWEYDTKGRVKKNALHNNASQYLFTYNSNGSTTVTNPLNKQTTYTFQTVAGAKRITSISGAQSPNCPSSNATFTYDNRGLIKTKIDNKGYLTTYDYDIRGLEESRTEASGTPQARIITTEWHPTLYRPITITEPNRILTYQYDDYGNLLSQTVTAP
jgi:YD repeat-containing protein